MKSKKDLQAFGLHFKSIRNAAKITQEQLAFDADVSLRTIQRIEAGEHAISLDLLFAIAKALHIHPRAFFDGFEFGESKKRRG